MTIKTRSETKTTKTLSRARKPDDSKVAEAKQAEIIDATATSGQPAAAPEGVALEGLDHPVTGRGVFAVRTLGTAVSVESAFLEETGNVLRLPAVFPNREYAMAQIDELRQIVNGHFDEIDKAAK